MPYDIPNGHSVKPPTSLADLKPAERAEFATTARLCACFVTESLVKALYFPLRGFEANGLAVLLTGIGKKVFGSPYTNQDVLAIIPLKHVPIFKHDGDHTIGKEIGLLDPLDMMPLVLEFGTAPTPFEHHDLCDAIVAILTSNSWLLDGVSLSTVKSPVPLWERYARATNIQEKIMADISEEFRSAVKWQTYSFQHPPKGPTFDSPSIDWEQSIVEGHPTHPMHKTRMFLSPMRDIQPGEYDLYHTHLRFVSLSRESLAITYDFEKLIKPVIDAAIKNAGKPLYVPYGDVVIPVHELQVAHIVDKFPEATIYPSHFRVPILAQQSVRSVILPGVYENLHLKLGVGIKLTSAVRTISPASAYLGPRFSAQVVPALHMDHSIVTVAKELASVVHKNPDGEIAKHCSVIIREAHDLNTEERGERLIVCTSLVESGHAGPDGNLPAVIRVFGLHSEGDRIKWLDRFVRKFFEAFLPSMLNNGVAFECHPQNCIARFDLQTKEIKGFIIRDFGGLRVHPPTLLATTGVKLDFVEGHSIIAPDLDDVYARMYHTVIHNHLQQLIRVLGLHYNGKGWDVVRHHFKELVPRDHGLYDAWLSPERQTFPGKCFLRMRMQGMYRFHLHGPFPNLLLYEGVQE